MIDPDAKPPPFREPPSALRRLKDAWDVARGIFTGARPPLRPRHEAGWIMRPATTWEEALQLRHAEEALQLKEGYTTDDVRDRMVDLGPARRR